VPGRHFPVPQRSSCRTRAVRELDPADASWAECHVHNWACAVSSGAHRGRVKGAPGWSGGSTLWTRTVLLEERGDLRLADCQFRRNSRCSPQAPNADHLHHSGLLHDEELPGEGATQCIRGFRARYTRSLNAYQSQGRAWAARQFHPCLGKEGLERALST
jgi:hypothetical protein